ncbi:MAG: peroxidase-related enzyme [Pseudomonadota bacterium]
MSWIKIIPLEASTGRLKKLYDQIKGQGDVVDDVMLAHSLRPHTLEGHMALYRNVLHHAGNAIPKWALEMIGAYVSILNKCCYCRDHHSAGLHGLIGDDMAGPIIAALKSGEIDSVPIEARYKAALTYAAKLTGTPGEMVETDVKALREAGFDDGEIVEINQVTAYFNYGNRTSLGLGASTEYDILGLSHETEEADI